MEAFQARVQAFQTQLKDSAEAAFFPLSADMQYLTGIERPFPNFGATHHPGAWLEGVWVGLTGEPVVTLTRMSRELSGVVGQGAFETKILGDWDDPSELVGGILTRLGWKDGGRLAIGEATAGETVVALCKLLPGVIFVAATEVLATQRRIKSEDEIAIMRQAGAITEAAFAAVLGQLQHGMTELDVVAEIDLQLRRAGGQGPSFTTSLYCSGPEHPLVFGHTVESMQRALDPPVCVLFDFGAIHKGYCYDFGRTVFFGSPAPEMIEIHRLVMDAQAAGIAALQAGAMTAEQADAAARKVIERAGYGAAFRHRLGHAIGLDVHEAPFLTSGDHTPLERGMLFTVEPSIMHDQGFSARVEDVVAVEVGGGAPLTRGHPGLIVID